MAAEQLKEQEVEVLMEWETDSSGTISAKEEIPIPVSPPMRKKPCHRQLPFDRNQSDREAAVAGLRQGTGNAQATARPSLQARRVAVMTNKGRRREEEHTEHERLTASTTIASRNAAIPVSTVRLFHRYSHQLQRTPGETQ
ncbi:uncharacterized protein LOC144106188 [Amblyomma americanum]